MDQNQEKILTEIKILEEKFKEGNKRKVTYSLVAGGVTGVVGGAVILAAPMLAPGMMMGMTVMPSFTTLALANVGLTLTGVGGGYFLTNGKKETQQNLSNAFERRIGRHLELLAGAENGNKIDFIFNIESFVYPGYQKIAITEISKKVPSVNKDTVLPLNMAGYYVKIGSIFRGFFEKSIEKRPCVEKVSITHAEMTDEQFQHLLKFEIGRCGTKTLDLSKNRLTVLSIQALRSNVTKNKGSFLELKSLNLGYNNLSAHALQLISEIVEHLGIEQLDLSGNDFNGTANNVNAINPELVKFLEDKHRTMPSLKVLKIANIGLTNNFSKSLKKMLKEPSILIHLDIRQNPHLSFRKLQSLLDKGFESNQSIQELLLDHRQDLKIENVFKRKDSVYAEMYKLANQNGTNDIPRFVFILNRYCQNRHTKTDIKGALSAEINRQLQTVAEGIVDHRMKIFKLPEEYCIPITEKEFVMYMNNTLENFYLHAISKNERKGLDERLFQKIGPHDPNEKIHQSSYDLDIEEQETAKKETLNDRIKASVLRPI